MSLSRKEILRNIAKQLNNKQYDDFNAPEMASDIRKAIQEAKEAGVVVVYGASDDLVEFDGALQDEAGCYGGGIVTFDEYGTSDDGYEHANKLQVRWMKDFDDENHLISFSYVLSGIYHETFMVYEEGYPYCEGLVFFASDMRQPR